MSATRLLLVAGALFLTTVILRVTGTLEAVQAAAPADGQPALSAPASAPNPSSGDYLGSKSCARCHDTSFEQWERSLHIKMTKPIAEATVHGDFRPGTRFEDHGRAFEFGMRDGKPFMQIAFGGRPAERFTVDYTLGSKRYQGYLSTLPDGRMYVLPAFWHVESRRWVDWKEITPIPDGAHDLRQIWNQNCFNCHATNLAQGFDTATRRYKTTWTEMGIGCEACHGPGREHVTLMEQWEQDPASKPKYDNSQKNRGLSDLLKIFSQRSSDPRRVYDTCAYCHGNKRNVVTGFRGGDRYEDFALPFFISEPIPSTDLQGEFWPDGRPNRFNRPQALTLSGCFKAGAIACTNCHVAHGSRHPFSLKVNITQGAQGDLLCTQCHTAPKRPAVASAASAPDVTPAAKPAFSGAALRQHTFHAPDSAGSRCIGCHMSDVNWRLLIRRRDHTFAAPVPEMTAAFGVPNACNTCHDDKTPEWAAKQMDQWWGDATRRKAALALADTMYRAGSGDRSTIPALAALAVDRSQGAFVRGSAVEFIEQLATGRAGAAAGESQTSFGYNSATASPAPAVPPPAALTRAQLNALIGAAADPEAMVRAVAVRALAATGDVATVGTPIVARLTDPARVVRIYAAEALLALGIVQLPGAAGARLASAQDEFVASLLAFPDMPQRHADLAWLEAQRGNAAAAIAAADTALSLQPRYARPLVVKGVIAARAGRYDEALGLWRKAKEFEPSYPNLDRLIEEALKLKGPGK